MSSPAGEAELGSMLAALRADAGLTQEELAERAGLSPHAISALERGTRTRPYPHTVRSLAQALDLRDDQRAALIASAARRRRSAAGPARSVPSSRASAGMGPRPAGLVVPPTPLVGREDDVAALLELARSGRARLITLTGLGGVGKTRLAAALAEDLAADHPDGVVPITLAPLLDATDVIPSIAQALALTDSTDGSGTDALDVVADHLKDLRLLLLLDNFEHLLSAAADVGRLVSRCPGLAVLVTSRSPLRVRGEHEYTVGPLALPAGPVTTVDELAASPSGALTLDRARAVSPNLDLTAANVQALGRLCERLAGLPLAIELATARIRFLSPTALLERLDDVASTSGARDLPERQRTMRATLDWSYGLLSSEQQMLFRLLSVFRSGARLEDLEAVAGAGSDVAEQDVVGMLEQLVEHSLVVVRPSFDGRNRYDMLEPVAQYARSLLVGPEAARATHAHAHVFAAMAEQAAAGFERSDQVTWLARAEEDEANLLVAIRRSLDVGDNETAARITWSMWLYWWLRGQANVGRQRAEQCPTVELQPALQGRVRLAAATMSYAAGDFEASSRHWDEALVLGTQEHDAELTCKSLAGVGLAALAAGDLSRAERSFRESLTHCHHAGDEGVWMRSLTHVWLGTVLQLEGDLVEATAQIEQGLEVARTRGDRLTTYVALYNLAQSAIAGGDHRLARSYLEEGVRLSEQTQDKANLAYFLDSLAVVESADGHPDRVAALLGAARGLRETVGANVYAYYVPDEALRARAESSARADLGDAAFDDSVDAARDLDVRGVVRYALATAD